MRQSQIVSVFLRSAGGFILLSVLAVGPFLRGLFFWTDLTAGLAVVSIGFGAWLLGRKIGGLSLGLRIGRSRFGFITGDWAGTSLLALCACYAVQFSWAIYTRGNVDVMIRLAAAYFIYIAVSAESTPNFRTVIAVLVAITAFVVAFIGYLQYLGVLDKYPDLVKALPWEQVPGSTVIGSFEYHNATAILILCGVLLLAGLAADIGRSAPASILGGAATFLAIVFFFCQSRGAFLVMPPAMLVLALGLDRERRWMGLMFMGTSILPAFASIKLIGDSISAGHTGDALIWTAFVSLLGALGGFFIRAPLRLDRKVRVAMLVGCVAVAAVAIIVLMSGTQWLPQQAERYAEIDYEGASSRIRFFGDALTIIGKRPLGMGGWGWARMYHSVQSLDYISREVHNHFLQVTIEAGIPGLIAFVAALALLVIRAWEARDDDGPGWALASAGVALAVHAAIDFDLSYGYLWLLLWVFLASSAEGPAARTAVSSPRRARIAGIQFAVLGFATVAIIGLSGSLFLGSRVVDKLEVLPVGVDATPFAAEILRHDPWSTEGLVASGTLENLEKAIKLDSLNPDPHFQMALRLEREYKPEAALKEAEIALSLYPWLPEYNSKVADLRGTLMLDFLIAGNNSKVRELAELVLELQNEVAVRTPNSPRNLKSWPAASATRALFNLRCGQALFLLGREADAAAPLKESTKAPLISQEANLWLFAIYERAGDTSAMDALLSVPTVRLRSLNPIYSAIKAW